MMKQQGKGIEAGATGFASIAFGYPNAPWGRPQTPEYEGWKERFGLQ